MKLRDVMPPSASVLQPQHQLLLRAALLDADAALPAFEAWHRNADWEGEFDEGTYQLMPQLYANLDRHRYDAPIMGRLRGLYRNAWYRNQQLLATLQNLIERLQSSDIPTMLLGNGALMHGYCISPGVRNLGALDILIPAECVSAARELMTAANWQATDHSDANLRYRQNVRFTNGDDQVCSLYWNSAPKTGLGHETSWDRARPVRLNSIETLVPDAPEMLLYQCSRGMTGNGVPTLPELTAIAVVAQTQNMDWSTVARLAAENFAELKLYRVLTAARAELDLPVPDTLLSELGDKDMCLVERLEGRAAQRRPEARDTFFGPLERLSLGFLHYTGQSGPAAMMAELPGYLRYHYGVDSLFRIFGNVVVNGGRRVGRVIGRLFKRDQSRLTA